MFRDALAKVMRREDLTAAEAAEAMDDIVEGRAAPGAGGRASRGPGDEGRASGRNRRLRDAPCATGRSGSRWSRARRSICAARAVTAAGTLQHLVGRGRSWWPPAA